MLRRLPIILGLLAAAFTFLLVGPVAVAVILLRSSSDAHGPSLAAQILIVILVLALTALAGAVGWGLTKLILRLVGRDR